MSAPQTPDRVGAAFAAGRAAGRPLVVPFITAGFPRGDATVQQIVDVPSERRTYDNTVGAIDDIIRLAIEMALIAGMWLVASRC